MPGGGAEGEDESGRGAFAEGIDYRGLQCSLAAWAVQSLADDDQDPPFAAPLAVANEAVHFALGLPDGVTVEIALRLDLESRVFQAVENAGVRGSPLPKDDSVALPFHSQWFVR